MQEREKNDDEESEKFFKFSYVFTVGWGEMKNGNQILRIIKKRNRENV